MDPAASLIEAGRVYLPVEAPWLDELINELIVFPNGRHDDQSDALSQALQWLKQRFINPHPHIVEFWRRQVEERNAMRSGH
jgi:phage terminase large subunit-like protein